MAGGLAALGAGGGGFMDAYNTQYDATAQQEGDKALWKGLQILSQAGGSIPPGGQPQMGSQPPMGGPPGVGGGMPPQGGPPMGGQPPMPPQGPPPMRPPMQGGGMQPPQGPPMGGAPGGGMPPPGGPPGMPPPGGGGMPPQGPQQGGFQTPGQGPLSWQQVLQAVQKGNPGAPPQVLMAAVTRAIPIMTATSQQEWRQQQMMIREAQLNERAAHNMATEDIAQQRIQQGEQRIQQGEERLGQQSKALDERTREFDIREKRLEANAQVRKDQGWQRLDQQRQVLEQRIKEGKDKAAIAQWRAIVDAQHKRATEIIQAHSLNSGLDDKQKKQMIEEADKMRDEAIKGIRASTGSSTPTGGTTTGAGPKVEGQAPKGTMDPTEKKTIDGKTYEKRDGQWYETQ